METGVARAGGTGEGLRVGSGLLGLTPTRKCPEGSAWSKASPAGLKVGVPRPWGTGQPMPVAVRAQEKEHVAGNCRPGAFAYANEP